MPFSMGIQPSEQVHLAAHGTLLALIRDEGGRVALGHQGQDEGLGLRGWLTFAVLLLGCAWHSILDQLTSMVASAVSA